MSTDNQTSSRKTGGFGLLIRRLLPIIVLVGAVGGVMAMGALKPQPEEKAAVVKAAPVLVASPVKQDVRLSVRTQGEVTPRTVISLVPQISGKITSVARSFLEGGAFQKGDVLIQIEQREYALRVTQARATVAQMRTRLVSEQAEAEVAKRESGALGIGADSALALREPQLAEAQAMLASAEAALEEAKLQLERTSIRAPFDGRVREKLVDIGEYVTPGSRLGEIFSVQIADVKIPLTDDELGQLGLDIGYAQTATAPGPAVTLSASVAGKPHQWQGRLARTDSGYDPETRVLFAYVEVEDPYGAGSDNGTPLAAGLFVTAEIEGRPVDGGMVVPRSALRGTDRVFIAKEDNTLEIRTVSVASSDRTRAILTSGLTGTEKVITSPVRGAADGMKVEVVDNSRVTSADAGETSEATQATPVTSN